MDKKNLKKLNRRLLQKHMLTSRQNGSNSVPEVAGALSGVNSQNLRDSYLSFWARIEGFRDMHFDSEFRPGGTLARTWTVRGTVHTFPSREYYDHLFGCPREHALRWFDTSAKKFGLPDLEKRIDKLYLPLVDEIKGQRVNSGHIAEFISARLEKMGIKGKRKIVEGWTSEPKYSYTWKGVGELAYLGFVVNAGMDGSRSTWMRTDDWLPAVQGSPDPADCASRLVLSYLKCYGPATLNDILYWTGHVKSKGVEALSLLDGSLYTERIDGSNETYYSAEDGTEDYPDPPSAIVLPRFDSIMMGHPDKARIIPEGKKEKIFATAGNIRQTVLLDGFAIGTWSRKKKGKDVFVHVDSFRNLNAKEKRAIKEKFSEYSEYVGMDVTVRYGRS